MIEPKKNISKLFRTPSAFESRIGKIMRCDRNERTIPFPEEHLKRILDSIGAEDVVAYPELEPFYVKLSNWLKVERSQVLLTSGSDTGIRAVFEVYVDEGDEIVILTPTYGMYAVYCEMFGGIRRDVIYNLDLSLPVQRITDTINAKTKLVAIANPNHTGTVLTVEELSEVLSVARVNNALVLVDEAYFHFSDITMLPHINKFDNLIVLRTFSKAFGIAPLRVGLLVSNKEIISQLYKVKLTHEITSISAKFGEYLLDNIEIMDRYVSDVKSGIKYLLDEFKALGLTTPPTQTNFLYAELPERVDAKKVIDSLRQAGIHISGPFKKAPFKNHIRITVGPVDQMRLLMDSMKQVYNSVPK
jgi:histidinol-phosphate aminotransferase